MKRIALLILLSFCAYSLVAEEKQQETNGVTASSELVLQISSLPEMKLGFTERFTFPFLQGESPMTEDNNISLALTAEISPISLNGLVEAVLLNRTLPQYWPKRGGLYFTDKMIDLLLMSLTGKKRHTHK